MKKLKLKIHWSFLALGLLMFVFGKFQTFLCVILTVLLHEFGHAFVGRKLGYKLNLVTLMPYGAMLSGKNSVLDGDDEIKIGIAGPIVNAILIFANLIVWFIFPMTYNLTYNFVLCNLYTLCFNLLPIYPLDGGRILVAILSKKMPRTRALQKTKIVGYAITTFIFVLFFVSFFFELNYMLGINALFLLIGLLEEDTSSYYEKLSSFDKFSFAGKKKRVAKLSKDDPIFLAYKKVTQENIRQIEICDGEQVVGTLTKSQILSSVLSLPIDTKLCNVAKIENA